MVAIGTAIRLDDKVALITGASRGIGLGIAKRYVEAGAVVIGCGRTVPETSPCKEFIPCDVRDPGAVQAMIDDIGARYGRIDIVVNNAGGSPEADAASASPRFSERIIALNLMAPLWISQFSHRWLAVHGGAIVNIASVSALRPSPGTAVYSAAKAGLVALTKSLAQEWGPAVRVNAIITGFVETEAVEATYGSAAAQAKIAETLGAKRLGTAQDIGGAAVFLASSMAAYITGATLNVDGGGERPGFLAIVKEHQNG